MSAGLGTIQWRARIRASRDGALIGAGVLLGDRYALTWADVLSTSAGKTGWVDVELVGSDGVFVVGAWVADRRPGGVALLELAEPHRAGTVLRRRRLVPGHRVRVAGSGAWVEATVGPVAGDRFELTELPTWITPDYAGACVTDAVTHDFVGILTDDQPFGVLPVETIIDQLPRVADWVRVADAFPLPAVDSPDPADRIQAEPQVPESNRFCVTCGNAVARVVAGQPTVLTGFCPHCGTRFSFEPALRPGDRIGGQYDILGCIAHGGLGWIYLATDTNQPDGPPVVLKGLIDLGSREAQRMADAERRVLAGLYHPYIVRTKNYVTHCDPSTGAEHGYVVMEYVSGLSLREVMHRHQGDLLRTDYVVAYVLIVLDVLAYLHTQGLVYGDMKPDNVILGPQGITVIDLGSLRRIDDRESPLVITRSYQVPREEIDARGLTPRSDLYSVGVMLDELLSSSDRPIPEPLQYVIERATGPYERRFAGAAEMAEQLDGVLREILSTHDGRPRPAQSSRFLPSPTLIDSRMGEPPSLDELIRYDTELSLTAPPAAKTIATRLPVPAEPAGRADTEGFDWPQAWHDGLRALASDDVPAAHAQFLRVRRHLPGEIAPTLGLGLCLELTDSGGIPEQYYDAIVARDPDQTDAVLGAARVRLARRDRAEAAAMLDRVPVTSRYRPIAEVAAIRALSARQPDGGQTGDGLPTMDDLAEASRRLRSLNLTLEEGRTRLDTVIWEAVFERMLLFGESGPDLIGEDAARQVLAELHRTLVTQARDENQARALRRRRADREAAIRRTATDDPLPDADLVVRVEQTDAVRPPVVFARVRITTWDISRPTELLLRITSHRDDPVRLEPLGSARQQLPRKRSSIGLVTVFSLGSWRGDQRREYRLTTALELTELTAGADVATIELLAVRAGGAPRQCREPVRIVAVRNPDHPGVRIVDVPVRQGVSAAPAMLDGFDAYLAGNRDAAGQAWLRATELATVAGEVQVTERLAYYIEMARQMHVPEPMVARFAVLSSRLSRPPAREGSPTSPPSRRSTRSVVHSRRLAHAYSYPAPRIPPTDDPRTPPPPSEPTIECVNCGYLAHSGDMWCESCGARLVEQPAAPLTSVSDTSAVAHIWCPASGPARAGIATRVGFALAGRADPGLPPLPQPIQLRVLLDTGNASVAPVTHLTWLEVDRTTKPLFFSVLPTEPAAVPLTFRVYRERDSQLLMEVTAELPVADELTEVVPWL